MATSSRAASIATCSKPIACSLMTAAGWTGSRMRRQTDPFLRERLHDLDDLANRLMRQLTGRDHAPSRDSLPENAILIARSMGPAALLDYDRKRLRGLVLEEGGPHSHVAIVA